MKMGVDFFDWIYEELVDILKVKNFLVDVSLFIFFFDVFGNF